MNHEKEAKRRHKLGDQKQMIRTVVLRYRYNKVFAIIWSSLHVNLSLKWMFLVILATQFGLMHRKLIQKIKREQVNNLFSIVSKKKSNFETCWFSSSRNNN